MNQDSEAVSPAPAADSGREPAAASEHVLREVMARAMAAQGRVDPDEVFALVETIEADDGDDRHEPPPIDPGQASFALEYESNFVQEWEAPDEQMSLANGRTARDEAMARVDAAVDPDWNAAAQAALDALIEAGQPFTADEIWLRVGFSPDEPRALGPVLRAAVETGRIVRHGERQSKIAKRHARPLAVWRPT